MKSGEVFVLSNEGSNSLAGQLGNNLWGLCGGFGQDIDIGSSEVVLLMMRSRSGNWRSVREVVVETSYQSGSLGQWSLLLTKSKWVEWL